MLNEELSRDCTDHEPLGEEFSSPDTLPSPGTPQRGGQVSQVDHQVADGGEGLHVVLLVRGADVLEPVEGGSQLGDEGRHGGDDRGGLSEFSPDWS